VRRRRQGEVATQWKSVCTTFSHNYDERDDGDDNDERDEDDEDDEGLNNEPEDGGGE
jgi:hypothetical protein